MTTLVDRCSHKVTRVVEHGGELCVSCGREMDATGAAMAPEPIRTVNIDGAIDAWAMLSRTPIGRREITVTAGVKGAWEHLAETPYPRPWAAGEILVAVLGEHGWSTNIGPFRADYGDESALTGDLVRAVRYLSGKKPVDLKAPPAGELERIGDALGFRLPRTLYRVNQVESFSTHRTFAEMLNAKMRPTPTAPKNLRR